MRILIGVPVTGEMLPGRYHAVLLQPMDQCGTHIAHEPRIFAKGTDADHRVRWVVVHVEHRRKRDVHPQGATLPRRDAALLIGEGRVAGRPQPHLRWENRSAAEVDVVRKEITTALTHPDTILIIRADYERQHTQALHRIEFLRDFKRRPDGHDEAADMLLRNQVGHTAPAGARRGREVSKKLGPDELCGAIAR